MGALLTGRGRRLWIHVKYLTLNVQFVNPKHHLVIPVALEQIRTAVGPPQCEHVLFAKVLKRTRLRARQIEFWVLIEVNFGMFFGNLAQ